MSHMASCNASYWIGDHLHLGQRRQQFLGIVSGHAAKPVALIGGDGAIHQHVARVLHAHHMASGP